MNLKVISRNVGIALVVSALFMLLSCVNFALYVRLLRGDTDRIHNNTELNAFFLIAAAGVVLVTLDLFVHHVYSDLAESLRFGGFQAISFLTTTGLSSADFNVWPSFSKMLLTVLSIIGGCSSSTGGALKVIRVVILSKMVWRSFTTRIHPNAVVTIKTNGKPVPSNIANKAVAYTLIFFVLFFAGTFLLIGGKGKHGASFRRAESAHSHQGLQGSRSIQAFFGVIIADGTTHSAVGQDRRRVGKAETRKDCRGEQCRLGTGIEAAFRFSALRDDGGKVSRFTDDGLIVIQQHRTDEACRVCPEHALTAAGSDDGFVDLSSDFCVPFLRETVQKAARLQYVKIVRTEEENVGEFFTGRICPLG